MSVTVIEPAKARAQLNAGKAVLVDVREPLEFAQAHVPGAINLPLAACDPAAVREASAGKPVIVMCRAGQRSGRACESLAGVKGLAMLAGGLQAWEAAGLPVERRVLPGFWRNLPLERQVQVVLGLLLLGFSGLALTVSPWFALGSLAIGGGLLKDRKSTRLNSSH